MLSTERAMVDACSGKMRNLIADASLRSARNGLRSWRRRGEATYQGRPPSLSSNHTHNHPSHPCHHPPCANPRDDHDNRPILPLNGIVMKTEEEQLLDRRTNPVHRGFAQRAINLLWRMRHSKKVTRDFPFRRHHDKTTWMGILFENRVVGVMETHFLGELLDSRLRPGQKMPALNRARASVPSEVSPLLSSSQRVMLSRANAHAQHLEFLANAPLHVLQRLHQTVKAESAEHRTFVVAEYKDRWFFREVITQPDGFTFLALEFQIQRKLLVQLLFKDNFSQRAIGKRLGLNKS